MMPRRLSPATSVVPFLVATIVGACSSVSVVGSTVLRNLSYIDVISSDSTFAINDTVWARVVAYDALGRVIASWSVGDSSIRQMVEARPTDVVVLIGDRVVGVGRGTTWLAAELEGHRDSLLITVNGTAHQGDITTDQVWTAAAQPHFVRGGILAGRIHVGTTAPATLTIEAGTEVRFSRGSGLYSDGAAGGALKAMGTPAAPIRMVADVGGDSANLESDLGGFWSGVVLSTSGSELHYVQLKQCDACLAIVDPFGIDPRPLIDHLTIRDAYTWGLLARDGAGFAAGSSALSVTRVGLETPALTVPISIEANEVGTIPVTTTIADNANNAIELVRLDSREAQSITVSQTWPNFGVPYLIESDIAVGGPQAPILTLPAGTELRFARFTSLEIGRDDPGGLVATGDSEHPVLFTGSQWDGILFGAAALPSSRLDHVIVEGGVGYNAQFLWNGEVVVLVNGLDSLIANSVIRLSEHCGIRRAWMPEAVNTDYTLPALNNVFSDNRDGDQCGPP